MFAAPDMVEEIVKLLLDRKISEINYFWRGILTTTVVICLAFNLDAQLCLLPVASLSPNSLPIHVGNLLECAIC